MTLRLDMLAAAEKAKNLLDDSTDLVVNFTRGQINPDGAFKARDGRSDLYYTVFGLESLLALNGDVPGEKILTYLHQFELGQSLDLVHLACLIRCWADLSYKPNSKNFPDSVLRSVENLLVQQKTIYACFLALGAFQDLNADIPNPGNIIEIVNSLKTEDGGYANDSAIKIGSTAATAAALTILHYLKVPPPNSAVDWMFSRCHKTGGFAAIPEAPVPDLLSTATALHGLALTGVSIDNIKEQCLEFIDSLWDGKGAFYGTWADEIPDCEYTYYALLALGHLS